MQEKVTLISMENLYFHRNAGNVNHCFFLLFTIPNEGFIAFRLISQNFKIKKRRMQTKTNTKNSYQWRLESFNLNCMHNGNAYFRKDSIFYFYFYFYFLFIYFLWDQITLTVITWWHTSQNKKLKKNKKSTKKSP